MKNVKEPARAWVDGRQVHCPFCENDVFLRREVKLNSTNMTLFGLDWANKSATGLICVRCGKVEMFLESRIRYEQP